MNSPVDSSFNVAAEHGHLNVVAFLLSKGADVKGKDEYGNTPLHSAAKGGHVPVAKLLIEK